MSELSNYSISSEPQTNIHTNSIVFDNVDMFSMEKQEALRFSQDTGHRRTLVYWMIWVVSVWLAVVLAITCINNILCLGISDPVLITLLATTTLNVLGLSRIVLNGLFGYRRFKSRNNSYNNQNKA